MSEQLTAEPFARESLSSYLRRVARRQFFTEPISFLRARGVEWHDRSRDQDLLTGVVLQQVANFFGLDLDRVAMLTVHPHVTHLLQRQYPTDQNWSPDLFRNSVLSPVAYRHWRAPRGSPSSSTSPF